MAQPIYSHITDDSVKVEFQEFESTGNIRLSVYDRDSEELIVYYEVPREVGRKLKRVFKD